MRTTEINIMEDKPQVSVMEVPVGDCFTADGIAYMRLGFDALGSVALSNNIMSAWQTLPDWSSQDPWIPCMCMHWNMMGGLTAFKASVLVTVVEKTEITITTKEAPKPI